MLEIKSIKKSGLSKYQIEFDDKTKISIYDSIILKHNILFKKQIDEDLLEVIKQDNEKEESYYKCVKFISKKIRSKKEITDYLDKMDIGLSEKKDILQRLENNRLINDELFARAYVQDKFLLTSDGPNKIKDNLIYNNINISLIENLLSEIETTDIYKKVEKLILKKIKSNTTKSNYCLKQKILYEMKLLGYDEYMIDEILNNNILKTDNSIIIKEYNKLLKKLSTKYEKEELERQIFYKLRNKGYTEEEIKNIPK